LFRQLRPPRKNKLNPRKIPQKCKWELYGPSIN
jgi:hypothetical protein